MGRLRIFRIALLVELLLVLVSFYPGWATKAAAAQYICPPNSLRVALGLNLSSAEFAVSSGNYELVDYVTQKVISPVSGSGTWVVAPKGGAYIQLSQNGVQVQDALSSMVLLRQKEGADLNTIRFKNKRYRGDLLIENLNGKIQIINIIDVEQYLYGVVGAEMGNGAPDEAYKAQAIVSRTYAFYYKEHPQLNYDLGITTQWQVYGGYDAEVQGGLRINQAVDATRGMAIYYDNNLIQAFFHANSGGYTESCENVWFSSIPYLQPVATPEDAYALQVPQNGGWPAVTYQWSKSFTRPELMEQLNKWNTEHPDDAVNVGEVQDLKASNLAVNPVTRSYLSTRTQSGRVTEFDFVGTKGVKSFFKDGIRSVLDLRSTLFDIVMDSTVTVWNAFGLTDTVNNTNDMLGVSVDGVVSKLNGNNGNYYVIGADGVKTVPKTFSTITINGKGYGHGLGMSQWGAWGMAVQGIKYTSIIEHFFNQGKNDGRLRIAPYNQ